MSKYLGIDVGGTSIKYAIGDEMGQLSQSGSVKTPKTLEEFYDAIELIYHQFASLKVKGIALSLPGAVDSDEGVVGGASALPYIHGPNIKNDLETRLNTKVELENDANCAALAEVWKGAASDVNDSCFVVSGTGIGGAVIKDKKIHKGSHLHGGEFGYMNLEFNYETKEMKTWSDIGSTVAVLRTVAKEKGVSIDDLDGRDIFDHYKEDPIYEKAVDKFYYALANGIYNLQYVYDPDKIVIGGGISVRDDLLDELNKRLDVIFDYHTHAKVRPQVLICQFQNDANIIGALYHFLTKNS